MERNTTSLIEILNLSAGYPQRTLFENLDLSLASGQLVCFMGPNGVGKSTLIKTLGGLIKPLQGTIVFNGNSILKEQLVSLVLTDPIRASYMTAYDVVVFGRYPYLNWRLKLNEKDVELIESALDKVNIQHLRHQPITELSDGQKQMVMIARALAQDTPVMILDEPTAHLDLNNRVEIMRLLKDLTRNTNKAILLATHELDLALQTADIIWLAGNRNNIITGIPEDLVLQGAFDDIFQFKGFDLRTGKMQHKIFRSVTISLKGGGHPYLWTRNLLERNGFAVEDSGKISIEVKGAKDSNSWIVNEGQSFSTMSDLIDYLLKLD
jgi:iron complex transport system ATP-binding protein